MGRISIFEFEDFSWYPAALRDLETDLLQFWISLMGLYDASVPQLTDLLARAEASEVVDLCSGGAGPWIKLKSKLEGELGRDLSVTLSDKFPNVPAFERARRKAGVKFESEPVDATRVPDKLKGVRTLYSCFHHFPPELAKSILRDAQKSGVPIAIFEGTACTVPLLPGEPGTEPLAAIPLLIPPITPTAVSASAEALASSRLTASAVPAFFVA